MGKTIMLISISLYFLAFLVSCNNTAAPEKSIPIPTKSEITQNEIKNTEPIPSSVEKIEPQELVIHEITGNSNKQSEKEKASMLKWRKDICLFALDNPDLVYINGQTDEKIVSLTFDDGPDNVNTPKILDILKKYNVKGNFFFIGNRLDSFKSVVKRTYNEGNLVLNHSWSHPELTLKDAAVIQKEITTTEDKIFNIIGERPAIIRPPYGAVDGKVLSALKSGNYKFVIWSIDTMDWSQRESSNIARNVLDSVRPGDIILMHSNEDKKATVEALPLIIDGLLEKGYKIVDLGTLLKIKPYLN